ncbi:hypothetical protein B0T17DRAFT_483366 [Bombardia bombarda]|uniref:E3 ubiquitin-protein ligase listerin n=1 Tax=Bombardia bombarda TaxID=252184 RepID=A0AA39XNB5_9PEZI|nr:hypothetical protein B0T17DRAFT_483366 [Bombardia bombarda]
MKRTGKTSRSNVATSTNKGGFGALATSTTTLSYITPPPDLSNIPQDVVVPFKNLLKKDSITKSKALEDILAYVQRHPSENGGTGEPVLEAWTQLYARTSIDNSRRVRELSHTLLLELFNSAKNRMAKRIPSIVGPWLAGTFDRDRAVSRAATDSLSALLTTEDKTAQFWRRCQIQILDYAIEAISETPDTLSDERSTTKEDIEAKYYRVVGSSLSLVLNLLKKADAAELGDGLAQYFEVEAVWSMAAIQDSVVRRTFYQLIQVCLEALPDLLKPYLSQIGRVLVVDSLKVNQASSAADLVKVLTELTKLFPTVWGAKKHPLQRVQQFIEKGSQGGSATYWEDLDRLLSVLPGETISAEIAAGFLKSMRKGISNREEPHANRLHAWACYIHAFERFIGVFTPTPAFLQQNFYPLTQQFLHKDPDLSEWTSPSQPRLFPKAWEIITRHPDPDVRKSVDGEWQRLAELVVSAMSNSLPEVSKEHQNSQRGLASEGDRWFTLVQAILARCQSQNLPESGILRDVITSASSRVLNGALDLLIRRNFKPFGAASVLQSAAERCPGFFSDGLLISSLFPLDSPEQLNSIITSPSLSHLVFCLEKISAEQPARFMSIWKALVEASLQLDPASSVSATKLLISIPCAAGEAQQHEQLQKFLISTWLDCAKGNGPSASWELSEAALSFKAVHEESLKSLTASVVRQLNVSEKLGSALRALELIVHQKPTLLSEDENVHLSVVTRLLSLTEITDQNISQKAAALQLLLDQHYTGERPLVKIIQDNLDTAGPLSLGIDTLLQQALATVSSGTSPLEDLFPNSNVWMNELSSFLQEVPNPSLSLTSSLGGAYLLVKISPDAAEQSSQRDRQGRSIPARMAVYTSKLLSSGIQVSSLPQEFQVELLYLLYLTTELATDQMTVAISSGLWNRIADQEVLAEVDEFITRSRKSINSMVSGADDWRESSDLAGNTLVGRLIGIMLQQTRDFSPKALYSAKTLSDLLQGLVEAHGPPVKLEEWWAKLGILRAAPQTTFAALAIITGFGETLASSKTLTNFSIRMISDMMGAFPGLEKTLYSVVLLNACLNVYEAGKVPIENRKQVIAFKQMASWTDTPDEISPRLAAETCKAIHRMFPNIKSMYGPYWEQIVAYCLHLWNNAAQDPPKARVPYIYSSLKLMSALEGDADANDDLEETLAQYSQAKSQALINLLKLPRDLDFHPSQIVDELLCRVVDKVPLEHLNDLSDLYGLVASDSRAIQTAAFGILHRALPAAQEKLAVDLLLEKKDGRLPDELLSLLLDAPTLESYPEDILVQFPTPIRSYLLAWLLIFDTYNKAPQKLRNDYTDCLKAEDYLGPLMEFMFDVLGHSAAHPLNLDKEKFTEDDHIRTYDIKLADSEPEEHNMQWLLIHLYYMVLKHLPGLFKKWYLACRVKQTKVAVEAWTKKHFSPLIVSEALDEVNEWASKQEPDDDGKDLIIKISKASREVSAGVEVDDEMASIAVRVPPTYPIESVEVIGVNRVAVSEKKWQNWIMATQGVITFANGSITDGLAAFQRNIIGTLKGQSECAICYSIVSSDKKLPDKKCGTCKHFFHRICLYKWFQSSNTNSCPLCRNPIDYLGQETDRRTQRDL